MYIPAQVAVGPTVEHTYINSLRLRLKAKSLAETTRPHEGKYIIFPSKLSSLSFRAPMNSIEMVSRIFQGFKDSSSRFGRGGRGRLSLRSRKYRRRNFPPAWVWFHSANIYVLDIILIYLLTINRQIPPSHGHYPRLNLSRIHFHTC